MHDCSKQRTHGAFWVTSSLIALAAAACAPDSRPKVGGESHWLAECAQDADCGDEGLSCSCGTCTRACAENAACAGGREASCYDPNSRLLLRRCQDRSMDESHGICLAECSADAECGSTRTCMQGACLPLPATQTGSPDADRSDAGVIASSAPEVSDFAGVSDEVSWSQPVEVPPPEITIAGGDASILGTWREVGCDPMDPDYSWGCVRLVIAQDDGGAITGAVYMDDMNIMDGDTTPVGPFAPVTDPTIGYPTELDRSQYWNLAFGSAVNVPYRMLDGKLQDGHLTFGWSGFDLWHEWCQQQTPHLWTIGDKQFYFCVPQDPAERAAFDPGRAALCTTVDLLDLCMDSQGNARPCVCSQQDQSACGPNYCFCDEQGCDANYTFRSNEDLIVDGARMSSESWDIFEGQHFERVELERVTP